MTVDKLKMHSPDLTQRNIDAIAELFPTLVTETVDAAGSPVRAVDFDALRQELSGHIVEGPQERYQLDWPGKRAAAFAANAPIAKTLRPVREESVDFDITKNLFIEGDNLDALKLLQESYLGKVTLIYIDPPYNTGNDFVYEDDFAESSADYLTRSSQKSETGDRLVANTEANGRFHSDWLSMMYSRLKLARGLLSDDGVIIAAIGDHEHANIRLLLDQVFGAENFISDVVWQGGRKNDSRYVSNGADYMLIYAKNEARLSELNVRWREDRPADTAIAEAAGRAWVEAGSDQAEAMRLMKEWIASLPDGDPAKENNRFYEFEPDGRVFRKRDISWPGGGGPRYDVLHPVTKLPVKVPSRGWIYSQPERMQADADAGLIMWGKDHNDYINRKTYLDSGEGQVPTSVFELKRTSAGKSLAALLGSDIFGYPKDTRVLARWINLVSRADPEAVILDFFAGSGSTGHAVMDLNAADGGHRRYILVQLDEAVDHPDYHTIAGLARERLRRAGAQAREHVGLLADTLDVGFRSLHVATTNMADTLATADELAQPTLADAVGSVKPDRTDEDVLFQVLLDWGLDVAEPIAIEQVGGYRVIAVADNALIACFDDAVSDAVVRAIAERHPLRAVFADSGFANDAARINAEQVFREVSPETEVRAI
jgi:adenine-specific DNA-methyltransferase